MRVPTLWRDLEAIESMKRSVSRIFEAKNLGKPGGQIYRTIASLPAYISVDELVECATKNGYGHRIENGVIRFFAAS